MLSCTLRARDLSILYVNEDIMNLSLPAQMAHFKDNLSELAKPLYEKYKTIVTEVEKSSKEFL